MLKEVMSNDNNVDTSQIEASHYMYVDCRVYISVYIITILNHPLSFSVRREQLTFHMWGGDSWLKNSTKGNVEYRQYTQEWRKENDNFQAA